MLLKERRDIVSAMLSRAGWGMAIDWLVSYTREGNTRLLRNPDGGSGDATLQYELWGGGSGLGLSEGPMGTVKLLGLHTPSC